MAIRDLFEKPIDRFIEGVIKADDREHLVNEMEEYIITRDIEKKLDPILESYSSEPAINGVWISGFFGSGKSHLLKMLSMVLEKRTVDGCDLSEIFLNKLRENHDEILVANMERSLRIPSRSILFNIDQKADSNAQNIDSHITDVFLKVFNEMCGYCSTLPFVAEFERDMEADGFLDELKKNYLDQNGKTWEDARTRFHTVRKNEFSNVYAQVTGKSEEEATTLLDDYRGHSPNSIEDFAQKVRKYIDHQPEGFRLNFFVDEVGQFVGDDSRRMFNLGTLAESLSTICGGKAWIFVTSQAALEDVIGADPGQEFSRVQDRFKVKVNLDGKDVSEVIQLRLLKKSNDEIPSLKQIYEKEKENIRTMFTFGDGNQSYQNIRDGEHFVRTYPMMPYQYDLFQQVLIGLSNHGAFTGRYTSVGERSMLGVFQDVLKEISDLQTGSLPSFDKMFQGIRQSLKPGYTNLVTSAENQLKQPLALKILQILALIKYVDSFKPTVANLSILLIDEFNISIVDLQKKVREALQLLEDQIYIQRNGVHFSYLTHVEKEIENKIKSTEVTISKQNQFLSELIFGEVIENKQFRFEDNRQNYSFARKMDSSLALGQDAELAINIVSPFHEHFDNEDIIRSQSAGKAEMLVLLPDEKTLLTELSMYLKTDHYIRVRRNEEADENERSILRGKGESNQKRRKQIKDRIEELLISAKLIVGNNEIKINGDPLSRLIGGFQELVRSTYPNLKMLKNHPNYQETDLNKYLFDDTQDLFASGGITDFTEAEIDIMTILAQNHTLGIRTTFKHLLDNFMGKPYGWPLNTVQCLLAQLYRKSKVEISFEGVALEDHRVNELLPQSTNASLLIIRPLEDIDPTKLKKLKDFHHDFFKTPNQGADYRSVVRNFRTELEKKIDYFGQLNEQATTYPFLEPLTPALETLNELKNKDDSEFLEGIDGIKAQYMKLGVETLDNIQEFVQGEQFNVYQNILNYWQENQNDAQNFGHEITSAIQELSVSNQPWKDTPNAMSALEIFRPQLEAKKTASRQKVENVLKILKAQIGSEPKFELISPEQQKEILKPFDDLSNQLENLHSLSTIEAQKQRVEQIIYVEQMNQLAKIKVEGKKVDPASEKISVSDKEIPVEYPKQILATEEDLEAYMAAMKKAYQIVLRENKKIALS